MAEQDEWLGGIFLPSDNTQPDHVLYEEAESALSEVSEVFWGASSATMPTMVVPVHNESGLHQILNETLIAPDVLAKTMGDLHNALRRSARVPTTAGYAQTISALELEISATNRFTTHGPYPKTKFAAT